MSQLLQTIERPFTLLEEDPQCRRLSPVARVDKMYDQILAKLPSEPQFILCVLPEKKNCDIYGMDLSLVMKTQLALDFIIQSAYALIYFIGPWKKKCLSEFGIVTQCISPSKINDQYLTNVLLKINSKARNQRLNIFNPFFNDS